MRLGSLVRGPCRLLSKHTPPTPCCPTLCAPAYAQGVYPAPSFPAESLAHARNLLPQTLRACLRTGGVSRAVVPSGVVGACQKHVARTSFTSVEQARPRLNRSELYVPGTQTKLFEKGAKSAADIITMDLEDSVGRDDKETARKNVVQALNEIDFGNKTVSVRINAPGSQHMYRDVIDLIEKGGERLDMFIIPMCGTAADIYATDMLTTMVETAVGRKKRIGFGMIIETALGLSNVKAIAAASKRNESP